MAHNAIYLRKRDPLGILNEFERRLEGMIEGVFTKAFRSGLHPVELATRVLKEMDANKTVGVRQVWVPNSFVFYLSEVDMSRFEGTEKALRRELEQVVREGAQERGWDLVGPPEVQFQTDTSLKQGDYRCESALVEGPTTSGPVVAAAPAEGPPEGGGDSAELVLIQKGKEGKTFALTKERVIIGRLAESDIVVPDPGVSRQHAEVRKGDGGFTISDLGSTNGTTVNGNTIGEHRLNDGDRITVGSTVLEFRRP